MKKLDIVANAIILMQERYSRWVPRAFWSASLSSLIGELQVPVNDSILKDDVDNN